MNAAAKLYGFDGTEPLPIKSTGGSYPVPTDQAEQAAQAFGQGRDTASPLQMASVASAVASGTWRQPFVVGSAKVSHALPSNVAATLRTFMTGVVERGTAAGVGLPAGTAGKTGTAEYGTAPPGGSPPTHAWFIGFRGTTAFAVVVEGGGFGGEVAAPIAATFLNALG
jgi:cell division protein FtsI/penicillin-binding protein 2